MPKRVLIVATNGFEQSELTGPRDALRNAGIETVVASPESGEIKGWKHTDWGDAVKVDMTLDDVKATEFDGLVLPGGQMNPDILRMNTTAVDLVRTFVEAGKPVAAICHGPWLLVEAGVAKGRTLTGWPSIRTDLRNAGAEVVDKEVVVDGNVITSRKPDDIPAFSNAMIAAVKEMAEAA
ncbi:MAG: protease [Novosphingobium sp.]|uniref:Glutamine amidotransferase n=1 Tax=Novosphingobium indicum TaxID=462949 RepID=A0ABQ2JN18_9SPHN|nr:type 1 glutamine amidotransferase domain-containing protein [Novosphingobium indicum]MAC57363.1 protease [Novosphingobium sp.]GGN47985.1 glutamine amidotransferase [Novosphingobium indicum]